MTPIFKNRSHSLTDVRIGRVNTIEAVFFHILAATSAESWRKPVGQEGAMAGYMDDDWLPPSGSDEEEDVESACFVESKLMARWL